MVERKSGKVAQKHPQWLFLNENDSTRQLPKSISLPCISDNTKSKNPNNQEKEQINSETENLRTEMISLKSFNTM